MSKFFRRRKFCRFTAEDVKEIDYKDLNTLRQYVTARASSRCCRTPTTTTSDFWTQGIGSRD